MSPIKAVTFVATAVLVAVAVARNPDLYAFAVAATGLVTALASLFGGRRASVPGPVPFTPRPRRVLATFVAALTLWAALSFRRRNRR